MQWYCYVIIYLIMIDSNIHPGEILEEEFLRPMRITAYRLSKEIGVQQTRISQIIKGERSITADTPLRLALFLELQNSFG